MRLLATLGLAALLAAPASAGFITTNFNEESDLSIVAEDGQLSLVWLFEGRDGEPSFAPGEVLIVANAPFSQFVVPTLELANITGSFVGDTIYRLPQIQNPNLPYVGIAFGEDEEGNPDYDGWENPVIEFLGANGPGVFSVWVSTDDGPLGLVLDGAGTIEVPVFSHSHYNFGFTAPGRYEVLVRAAASRGGDGGFFTSDTFTLFFDIEPTAVVPVPATALVAGLSVAGLAGLRRVRRMMA